MSTSTPTTDLGALPVVVIGAGPVGLAAAAHLADRGLPFVVLEAGDEVGRGRPAVGTRPHLHPVAVPRRPDRGEAARPHRLDPPGHAGPADRRRARRALPAPAGRPARRPGSATATACWRCPGTAWTRPAASAGPSARSSSASSDDDGAVHDLRARAVIDASGTWEHPNPLGASGLPAAGEDDVGRRARRRPAGRPGPRPGPVRRTHARWSSGAGHSAANTLLTLARLAAEAPGTRILWAIRGADPSRVYGGGAADELAARGRLGTDLRALVDSGAVELHHRAGHHR